MLKVFKQLKICHVKEGIDIFFVILVTSIAENTWRRF